MLKILDPSESTCFQHIVYSLHGLSSVIAQIPHRQVINIYSEIFHCLERIFASSLQLHCHLCQCLREWAGFALWLLLDRLQGALLPEVKGIPSRCLRLLS